METLRNPNPDHGCLTKALADEPMFILLARDPAAPAAIRRWAKYRRKWRPEEEDQIATAEQDALDFEDWRDEHQGEWKNEDAPRLLVLIPSDEISSLAGHVLGSPILDDDETDKLINAIKTADDTDAQRAAVKEALDPARKVGQRLAGFVLNADPIAGPQDG